MKCRKSGWYMMAGATLFLILILDTQPAISGIREGINLCLSTVIPSLMPFILMSVLLTSYLLGSHSRMLIPICKLFHIPQGTGALLIAGFLGGYPVGAQCVNQAYQAKQINPQTAQRMLAFTNNCGPAFLFGMIASIFNQSWVPWTLWLIHVIAALCVARCLPYSKSANIQFIQTKALTFVQAVNQTIGIMARICGWIVIFRMINAYLSRWIAPYSSNEIQVFIAGFLELSNGCVALANIHSTGLRFLLCSTMIGFGGLCVTMQTYSVTEELDCKLYLPGKILHGCISMLIAYPTQLLMLPKEERASVSVVILGSIWAIIITLIVQIKKRNKCSIIEPVGV